MSDPILLHLGNRRPTLLTKQRKTPTKADGPIKGKIQYVDNEDLDKIYINIGSNRGIAINQEFAVYTRGKPVRDLDTGEVLTYLEKQVAVVAVAEILNDKIFRVPCR